MREQGADKEADTHTHRHRHRHKWERKKRGVLAQVLDRRHGGGSMVLDLAANLGQGQTCCLRQHR